VRRPALFLALTALLAPIPGVHAQVILRDGFETVQSRTFFEPFTWLGEHASTINHQGDPDHAGTTVWWNEDHWDIVGDSSWNAVALLDGVTGYHVDIHKSATSDPHDGEEENHAMIVGGDGSRGVAAMRLDYEGISAARLRNPMLVSATTPGVVEFYAPKFVTSGHWWEIALTPTTGSVISGQNTTLPTLVARPPFEDSLNFIAIGYDDIPCFSGWHARFDVHRTLNGVVEEFPMDLPGGASAYPAINPNQKMVLTHWRLEFFPDRVELYADLDANGSVEHVYQYPVGVPWPEVHVALLGVAYQADHHPQDPACYQGLSRELVWRDVTVRPVKYANTSIAPRNVGTSNVRRDLGWMAYDMRDIQRFGPAVEGVPQANPDDYSPWSHAAFTSIDLTAWPQAPDPVSEKTLAVTLNAAQAASPLARLVYDIKGSGSATLFVNGTQVGVLPGAASLRYAPQTDNGLPFEWVHRSRNIPSGLLNSGNNQIRVVLSGPVVMDRLHLEFAHD
jgi:hypothetical protein